MISFKYDVQWFNKSSDEQKNAADSQTAFSKTLQDNYNAQFGQATSSLNFLQQRLQQVFSQAQAGYGYSPAQLAALRTNNIEGQANATQQAQTAANRQIQQRGAGGGTTSGAAAQIAGQIATASANQGAANNRNIDIANATQAQSNLASAGSLLSGVSGQQTALATGTAGSAVNQSGNAFNAVNSVYQPSNFWSNLGQGLLSGGLNAGAAYLTGGVSLGAGGLFGGKNPVSGSSAFQNQYGQQYSGG